MEIQIKHFFRVSYEFVEIHKHCMNNNVSDSCWGNPLFSFIVYNLGFTRDRLLRQLCNNMNDEWIKVAVMLGLSFRTVETYRTNSKISNPDKKFKVSLIYFFKIHTN